MSEDLTNLTWLTSINTNTGKTLPLSAPVQERVLVSTPQMQVKVVVSGTATTPLTGDHSTGSSKLNSQKLKRAQNFKSMKNYRRPSCSYASLIAMALKASPMGCLPVNEIYRFIEQKYPFYKTAPEGWKNSIRHNLSMNSNFIKVARPDKIHSKKGYYWAINPARRDILDIDINKSLKNMKAEGNEYGFRLKMSPNSMISLANNSYLGVPTGTIGLLSQPHNYQDHQRSDVKVNPFHSFPSPNKTIPGNNCTIKQSPLISEPYEWVADECIVDGNDRFLLEQQRHSSDITLDSLPSLSEKTTNSHSNNISVLLRNRKDVSNAQSLEMLLTKLDEDPVTPSASDLSFQSSTSAIHRVYHHQDQPDCFGDISASSSSCEFFTANNSTSILNQPLPFSHFETSY